MSDRRPLDLPSALHLLRNWRPPAEDRLREALATGALSPDDTRWCLLAGDVVQHMLGIDPDVIAELLRLRDAVARVRALADDPEAEWMYVMPGQIRDALDADEIARRQAIQAAESAMGRVPKL